VTSIHYLLNATSSLSIIIILKQSQNFPNTGTILKLQQKMPVHWLLDI